MTKVGILIPDRGDRPEFLKNCLRQLEAQTLRPEIIELVNYPPVSNAIDITPRYRKGYEALCGKNLDVIAIWENDDWYDPMYLEIMTQKWEETGKPLIFGCNFTIYYHLKLKKYYTMYHEQRSSGMNTLICPNIPEIKWPAQDYDPYVDLHLWTNQPWKGLVFRPGRIICVGMKHGVGKCGGFAHVDTFENYINEDNGFLQNTLDEESFKFYSNIQIP